MSIYHSLPSPGGDLADDLPGVVLRYRASHVYPAGSHDHDVYGIDFASIPPWCVPGHEDDEDDTAGRCAPWLRMGPWVIDEDAARSLVGALNEWLARPKVRD